MYLVVTLTFSTLAITNHCHPERSGADRRRGVEAQAFVLILALNFFAP
jgi:hypothetical protein